MTTVSRASVPQSRVEQDDGREEVMDANEKADTPPTTRPNKKSEMTFKERTIVMYVMYRVQRGVEGCCLTNEKVASREETSCETRKQKK